VNRIVLGFFLILLTARFFSETIRVIPKAFDLVDLAFIPLIAVGAILGGSLRGVDRQLHGRMLRWTAGLAALAAVSAIVNFERTHYAPVLLFIFGIAAGPVLFLALNRLIRDKEKMARQTERFLYLMFIVEGVVVVFVSLPTFFATGNPDYVAGTFGLNAYQFSALLVIIGGYFLGRMRHQVIGRIPGIAIQLGVVITFLLLQYRTATPAFFIAYLVLVGLLYGRKILGMFAQIGLLVGISTFAFQYIGDKDFDLKFDDLLDLARNPAMIGDFGKVVAYGNTFQMYGEEPKTIIFGAGPGTMVSRSAYTFIVEPMASAEKGVGRFVTGMFPDVDFRTDVFAEYVEPLFELESVFGSVQANNPASSILAVMSELGLPGLVLLILIYGTMMKQVVAYARFAIDRGDPELVPLASALVTGSVYLCLLAPLDNYFEIARVTLPVWLLFWTVSSMVQSRRQRELFERMQLETAMADARASYQSTYARTR
jgi:hypothetical protein